MTDENRLTFERDLALRQAKLAKAGLQVVRLALEEARPLEALRTVSDEIERIDDELATIEDGGPDGDTGEPAADGGDEPSLYDARRVADDELRRHLETVVTEAASENWGNVRTNLDTALARSEQLACAGDGMIVAETSLAEQVEEELSDGEFDCGDPAADAEPDADDDGPSAPTVTFTVDRSQVAVAGSTGLLKPHPDRDEVVFWGPKRIRARLPDEVTTCLFTANTQDDLDEQGRVEYLAAADDEQIVFELVGSEGVADDV